jgi:hypothetical protein
MACCATLPLLLQPPSCADYTCTSGTTNSPPPTGFGLVLNDANCCDQVSQNFVGLTAASGAATANCTLSKLAPQRWTRHGYAWQLAMHADVVCVCCSGPLGPARVRHSQRSNLTQKLIRDSLPVGR